MQECPTLRVLGVLSIDSTGWQVLESALPLASNLRGLDMHGCRLHDDDSIERLATLLRSLPAIETLDLQWNSIGAHDAQILTSALPPSLRSLALGHNELSDEGCALFATALLNHSRLERLDLSVNHVQANGARALARLLRSNIVLTSLDLLGNHLRNDGVEYLLAALNGHSALRTLNVFGNGITNIDSILQPDLPLHSIDVGNNAIGDAGALVLANLLRANPVLSSLYLQHAQIGNAGVDALATALTSNSHLQVLSLAGVEGVLIQDNGASALARALLQNTGVRELYLWSNAIGDAGARALANAMEHNMGMRVLDLRLNAPITAQGGRALLKVAAAGRAQIFL